MKNDEKVIETFVIEIEFLGKINSRVCGLWWDKKENKKCEFTVWFSKQKRNWDADVHEVWMGYIKGVILNDVMFILCFLWQLMGKVYFKEINNEKFRKISSVINFKSKLKILRSGNLSIKKLSKASKTWKKRLKLLTF